MAGYLGKAKTTSRVVTEFYWPGVNGDVTRFCRSCDVCKGRVTKVPLGQMPLINTPVKRKCDIDDTRDVKRECDNVEKGVLNVVCAAVIEDDETDSDIEVSLECPLEVVGEGVDKVDVSAELTKDQRQQINALLAKHSSVFTDKPGCTNLLDLKIKLNTSDPIRIKGYPVPYNAREAVDEEVSKMLDLGVIEPSNSPYSSPVVLVRKKDGTNRFCIDFRQLNKITVFDAEPMPDMEGLFAKLSGNRWISKLDLSKGYWQVPIVPESRALTAFATQKGLYQFKVMPFGLVGASATCCRLMRKLLKGLTNVDSFVDDIFVFTNTWSEHMYLLGELFNRLHKANLTVRPTKCSIGYTDLDCLGHRVSGMVQLKPHPRQIDAIRDAPRPINKTQVRSFLGLVGFYRKFIPNFAAIASPLSDLTKKGQPNKVVWGPPQDKAFRTLKEKLVSAPILTLPDVSRPFILRTDASETGLGAVLLQEQDGSKLPVAYSSRKLLPREKNYSVIEKECLAVVWGIGKYHAYLFGRDFVLETDHQPLLYLNKAKVANARLMRWALILQPYRFRVEAIRGSENIGADYLSRV